MTDLLTTYLIMAVTAFASVCVMCVTALKGFERWIAYRQAMPMSDYGPIAQDRPAADIRGRIELADVRERLRRLEAIAAGIE